MIAEPAPHLNLYAEKDPKKVLEAKDTGRTFTVCVNNRAKGRQHNG